MTDLFGLYTPKDARRLTGNNNLSPAVSREPRTECKNPAQILRGEVVFRFFNCENRRLGMLAASRSKSAG